MLSDISLEANSRLTHPEQVYLVASSVLMRHASHLEAREITLEVGYLHMEGETMLDTSGRGPVTTDYLTAVDPSGHGLGGGHGGFGGGSDLINFTMGQCCQLHIVRHGCSASNKMVFNKTNNDIVFF